MPRSSLRPIAAARMLAGGALVALATAAHAVPYVQTPYEVVDAMLEVARVGPEDRVIDLGSGDGRIVIVAAQKYGARGIGIEQNPELVAESRRNAERAGVADRVEFREADLHQTDLRDASVVTMYLLPSVNMVLRLKFLAQLAPGTRVVSHNYDMGDWRPDQELIVGDARVYAWVVPANAAGTWRLTIAADGDRPKETHEIEIRQRFQELTAVARGDDTRLRIERATLSGQDVELDLAGVSGRDDVLRFSGRVDGEHMTGTLSDGRAATFERVRAGKISTDPPKPTPAQPADTARP